MAAALKKRRRLTTGVLKPSQAIPTSTGGSVCCCEATEWVVGSSRLRLGVDVRDMEHSLFERGFEHAVEGSDPVTSFSVEGGQSSVENISGVYEGQNAGWVDPH